MEDNRKWYTLGDMLKIGNQILRKMETRALRRLGADVYNALEQKDINDKSAQTVESNNKLAERIFEKDSKAIYESKYIVADVDNDSVGSSVEIGQIAGFNFMHASVTKYLNEGDIDGLKKFLKKHPFKEVFCHTSDIRHTNIPEVGMRRSFSINQYLYGAILYLTRGRGIRTFKENLQYIKETIFKIFNGGDK